jgi:hypothetical protein
MKIKCLFLTALILAVSSINFAQSKTTTAGVTPDAVVRSLYAAQKAGTDPFFQSKSRARVDKYFTKELADLIWNDSKHDAGEEGNIDFDPLSDSQDSKITQFKIGKPEYGEGNLKLADVPVTFKNFGKAQTILFRLEQTGKVWKISDISYPSKNTSLKGILTYKPDADSKNDSGIRSVDFLNYSYQSSVCAEVLEFAKTIKITNGEYKDADNFLSVLDKKVIYGDVDGDGNDEAILQISCGALNSSTLRDFEIPVYTFQNGKAKMLARLDNQRMEIDYKKYYPNGFLFVLADTNVKVQNNHVIVEVMADGSYAYSKNIATFDYKLTGGKFVLTGKPAQRRNK